MPCLSPHHPLTPFLATSRAEAVPSGFGFEIVTTGRALIHTANRALFLCVGHCLIVIAGITRTSRRATLKRGRHHPSPVCVYYERLNERIYVLPLALSIAPLEVKPLPKILQSSLQYTCQWFFTVKSCPQCLQFAKPPRDTLCVLLSLA